MVDFTSHELKLLVNQFRVGNVVLFAGAGFSVGAKSGVGKDLPTGPGLAALLAAECGAPYDGEELAVVYDYAQKRLGSARLNSLLATYYRDCSPAPWQLLIPRMIWSRIYTTNIDDVIESAWAKTVAPQKLRALVSGNPYEDRDPWFESVHCVHLHGSVLDLARGLTFSPAELAAQTATINPWYQALLDDLYANSVLFVGSRLSEAPFHHYLALRAERLRGQREFRGTAFLVSDRITPIRKRQLEDQGIYPIEATAEEFFGALTTDVSAAVPNRIELLKNRYPHQIEMITSGVLERRSALLTEFEYVRPVAAPPKRTARDTFFFEGAEPTWEDIASDVDAHRTITPSLLRDLQAPIEGPSAFLVTGEAGAGKSALLRRLAFEIAREGQSVYFLKSARRFRPDPLIDLLRSLGGRRVFLFVDDVGLQLAPLEQVLHGLDTKVPVTIVMGERPHVVLHRLAAFQGLELRHVELPLLDRDEAGRILDRLKDFGLLGVLQGKTREQQLREFLGRSRKQLLVALKEATAGKGFDAILANEFATLASDNARLAYTATCLAFMHGAPVSRRHLLAVMDGTDLEKGRVLAEELRGVVVPWKEGSDLLTPRHRIIARHVSVETAAFDMKQAAILRLLTAVAGELTPENIRHRTPEYVAYRGIINLDNMLQVLGEDYDTLGHTYTELDAVYSNDFLFKLQFGRFELHFDRFERAENYLNQSLAIRPKEQNVHAWHQMGVLRLKQARWEMNSTTAAQHAEAGEKILKEQIVTIGAKDAYPYAALVQHKLRYLRDVKPANMAEQLEELHRLAETGLLRHPLDAFMRETHGEVARAYLMQAVKSPPADKASSKPF